MKLKEINNAFDIDGGAPEPIVLSNDDKLFLGFYGNKYEAMQEQIENSNTVTVKFSGYIKYTFGIPTNETLHGHRYYSLGLRSYGFYELENSDLIGEIIKIERIHTNFDREKWKKYKHYIISFHDNLFECVAKDFEVLENHSLYNQMFEFLK